MHEVTSCAPGAQDMAMPLKDKGVKPPEWSSFKTDKARLTAFLARELRIFLTVLALLLGSFLR